MVEPCIEDPSKEVGAVWQCTNPKCTCTCLADGHVEATCENSPDSVVVPMSAEEVFVKLAFVAVLAFLLCFVAACCFMFRRNKGTRSRAESECFRILGSPLSSVLSITMR